MERPVKFVQVLWSAASINEARLVCRYLVEKRLIACAQILPWIESIYMWNNRLDTAQESLVLLKTREEHVSQIEEVIQANTSYEVPEILVTSIDGGLQKYLSWIEESTKSLN